MEIKSVMHDATPSWNGFNYQGKVGVYVCLSMILEQLKYHDKDSVEFQKYLNEHAVQYEWIEDFSILQNDTYISHHQVKHKAGTGFATHLDALITIRNRNKKILSPRDLNKYFTAEHDVDDGDETLDNKKMERIKFLIELGCLSEEGMLSPNWKEKIDKSNDYYLCLLEFEEFSQNAFDNAIVYFHTTENVSEPTKVIFEYAEIKVADHLICDFEDKSKLVDLKQLNIHIGKTNNSLFDLVLSDVELEKKITRLVDDILVKQHASPQYSQFNNQDKDIYYNALLHLIDKHIAERHSVIRKKIKNGKNFTEQKEVIKFEEIYNIFSKVFHNIDKEYLELLCQRKFNDAYNSKLERLYDIGCDCEEKKDIEKSKYYLQKYLNLLSYREKILNRFYIGKYRKLLRELAPHIFKEGMSVLDFYTELIQKNVLENVLCEFLSSLSLTIYNDHLVFYSLKEGKKYYVSSIDLSDDDEYEERYKVTKFQEKMTKLSDAYTPNEYLASSDYLLVQLRNPKKFSCETSRLLNITDVPEKEKASITKGNLLLKSFSEARKDLNDE